MCGIAGIVAGNAKKYADNLQRMVKSLSHRGPDGAGAHFFTECALGHARLSIIDIETGDQPMISSTGDAGITFNGEIYGYKDIRASLADFRFCTTSDTEVILALYQRYGSGLLSHLPGMFAFALWDDAQQELFCGRDRFGEKPLYYAMGRNGEFVFASEIKAVIASGLIAPIINNEAVTHYLKHLYVHPSKTIYKNIHTLPPAHSLKYRKGRISIERYWHLPESRFDIDYEEAIEEFSRLLDQAVARQLIADVPVGAFLSGGLDSSTVVSLASRHKASIKTFAFGFGDSINELPFARGVAQLYGTEHAELVDDSYDVGTLLLMMQDVYDEPFADSSNIPTYLISEMASKYIKVVLTGDGGDELLGGYSYWYRPLFNMQQEMGRSAWSAYIILLADRLLRKSGITLHNGCRQKMEGIDYSLRFNSISQAHYCQNQYFTDQEIGCLGLNASDATYEDWKNYSSNTVDDAMRMDVDNYMPGDILVKTDRASMAHGLELRAPFLDVDFASFCISLPSRMKIDTETDKLIMRRAFESAWPAEVRTRGKQGFGAPIGKWIALDSVKALSKEYLDDPDRKIFSLMSFNKTREAAAGGDYKTWILLVLALWMERHEFNFAELNA